MSEPLEYRTETFRGKHCTRDMTRWRSAREREGWEYSTWSGVSGVGSFSACSITMQRWLIDRVQTLTTLRQADAARADGIVDALADAQERVRLLEGRIALMEPTQRVAVALPAPLTVVTAGGASGPPASPAYAGGHAHHVHRDVGRPA